MLRRHITCQWNGQATRLIRNKCRGRAAQGTYVWLRSPAYVTGSRPRGSIGFPPRRGAEAHTVWSEHVSAPDPRLALIKAWVFFVPESRDPSQGSGSRPWRSLTLPGGPVCVCRGLAPSHGGPDPLLIPWRVFVFSSHVAAPEPSTWWGRSSFTTRLEIATWVSRLHTVVRGTPVSGYRQILKRQLAT
jgi:hypothetical protein